MNDKSAGFRDRMAGYYDKYYRYNRKDGGTSYDAGCAEAVKTEGCPGHCVIIEVIEANV